MASRKKIEQNAVKVFGVRPQLMMLQEECGELVAAIGHMLRERPKAEENVVEEMVDVEILINQLKINVAGERMYKKWKNKKYRHLEKITDFSS